MFAPWRRSRAVIWVCPLEAASSSGVEWPWSRALTSQPCASSACTQPPFVCTPVVKTTFWSTFGYCAPRTATCSGVRKNSSPASTDAPCETNAAITDAWSFMAATWSGEQPLLSWAFGEQPSANSQRADSG
eukprot:Lithocolla_globosa_v1_NODE_1893_length_2270_cov_14.511061.p2 type:complete len:131 gc:universal NODE_1893_length_2270_cov_14.511061:1180-1572(+)